MAGGGLLPGPTELYGREVLTQRTHHYTRRRVGKSSGFHVLPSTVKTVSAVVMIILSLTTTAAMAGAERSYIRRSSVYNWVACTDAVEVARPPAASGQATAFVDGVVVFDCCRVSPRRSYFGSPDGSKPEHFTLTFGSFGPPQWLLYSVPLQVHLQCCFSGGCGWPCVGSPTLRVAHSSASQCSGRVCGGVVLHLLKTSWCRPFHWWGNPVDFTGCWV